MFSPMIQSLISSSGQQTAIQRSLQLQSYINPPKVNLPEKTVDKKSFAEVLKSSQAQQTNKTGFGALVPQQPSEEVKAKILSKGETTEKVGKFGLLTGISNKFNALRASDATTSIPEVSRNARKINRNCGSIIFPVDDLSL